MPEGMLSELLANDLYVDVFTDQVGLTSSESRQAQFLIAPELGGQLVPPGTPEPGTLAMLSLGLASFGYFVRRRVIG
jgi:hypothetical protein